MDIEALLQDMLSAANDAVKDDVGDIKQYAKQIMENEKQSLQELAEARITGVITDGEFDEEVEREKIVVRTELLTIQIMTEAAAQKAVNAALKTFTDAVRALI